MVFVGRVVKAPWRLNVSRPHRCRAVGTASGLDTPTEYGSLLGEVSIRSLALATRPPSAVRTRPPTPALPSPPERLDRCAGAGWGGLEERSRRGDRVGQLVGEGLRRDGEVGLEVGGRDPQPE